MVMSEASAAESDLHTDEDHGEVARVRESRRLRHAAVVVSTLILAMLLSACTSEPSDTVPMPVPVPVVTNTATAEPSTEPTSEPKSDPTLNPEGTAFANLEYFNFVNMRLLSVNKNPSSAAIVQNLLNAGFDKSTLAVTPDKTIPLRRPADSVQFAVRIGDNCLVGQFHSGVYSSMTAPIVNGENCLIGDTVTIP